MKIRIIVLLSAMLAAVTTPSVAHHSPANFDLTVTDFAIKGKIEKIEFRNPHSEMELLVTDAKGQVSKWDVEFSSVNLLIRRGWKLDRLKYGDIVTCIGNPDKTGGKKMYMWSIKLSDGTEYKK